MVLQDRGARRVVAAGFLLSVTLATTACKEPARSPEWELMRRQAIHDAFPEGSTRLGRDTQPPREVLLPGMGAHEGWFETVYASPLAPAEAHAWYAARFAERYRMTAHGNERDGSRVLQGTFGSPRPMIITVQVSPSRPLSGHIRGRFPDGPPGTRSYVFIWAATR